MVEFNGWGEPPFEIVDNDPFHLYATNVAPDWMRPYFEKEGCFLLTNFSSDLLISIDRAVTSIFEEGRNPKKIEQVTPNCHYQSQNCKACHQRNKGATLIKLSDKCVVTVCQTKIGICLQLQWRSDGGLMHQLLGGPG